MRSCKRCPVEAGHDYYILILPLLLYSYITVISRIYNRFYFDGLFYSFEGDPSSSGAHQHRDSGVCGKSLRNMLLYEFLAFVVGIDGNFLREKILFIRAGDHSATEVGSWN